MCNVGLLLIIVDQLTLRVVLYHNWLINNEVEICDLFLNLRRRKRDKVLRLATPSNNTSTQWDDKPAVWLAINTIFSIVKIWIISTNPLSLPPSLNSTSLVVFKSFMTRLRSVVVGLDTFWLNMATEADISGQSLGYKNSALTELQ